MHEITRRAIALQDLVRNEAPASEAASTLSRPVVDALLASRVFDMAVPRVLGGSDVDGRTYLEAIEAVAEGDGAAGWCVMIGAECNAIMGAMLPEPVSERLFSAQPFTIAGSAVPAPGTHTIDLRADGAHVSGRWRFASGCPHSAFVYGAAPLTQDGQPVISEAGHPVIANAFVARDRAIIHDNWRPMGLRGTGSNDFELIDAVTSPEFVVRAGPYAGHRPALFRLPMGAFLAMGKAAVATGIARGAINALLPAVEGKVPWLSATPIRDEPRFHLQLAEAEATLRSARAFLFEAQQEAWDAIERDGSATIRHGAMIRLASVHAVEASCRAVELAYHAAGTSSMDEASPLQRAFRDVHSVRQHANVAARFREDAGRVLAGLPPKERIF